MPCYILLTSCCRCPFQQPAAQSPSRPALQGDWTASVAQVQPNFGPTSLPALNALSLHLPVCSQALNVLPPVPINCVVPPAIPFLIEFDFWLLPELGDSITNPLIPAEFGESLGVQDLHEMFPLLVIWGSGFHAVLLLSTFYAPMWMRAPFSNVTVPFSAMPHSPALLRPSLPSYYPLVPPHLSSAGLRHVSAANFDGEKREKDRLQAESPLTVSSVQQPEFL
jgi:hypothetical protein